MRRVILESPLSGRVECAGSALGCVPGSRAAVMAKQRRKKRGRPRTGHDPMIGVRLPKKLLKAVDKYAEKLFPYTRSAVIRKAVEDLITPPHLRALRNDLRDV